MKNKDIFKLLDGIKKEDTPKNTPIFKKHDKVVIIDGLNLFLRNFAMINYLNKSGNHTGGLGGFLRSLGSLIKTLEPTEVYLIFDGKGSSETRKNLLPEYKSGRHVSRITNWDIFKDVKEENDAKINQIVRLIKYLKCLPVKTTSLDRVEADDIIAHLSYTLVKKYNSKVYIVSADQDYLQLVDSNITLYRPVKREFYTPSKIKEEYGVLVENFIIYKTLMGDNSDKVKGIQGLGKKKLLSMFPELAVKPQSLQEIFTTSEKKYKEHVIYSRVVFDKKSLENNYKIMDLKNPLLDEVEKEFIEALIEEPQESLNIEAFLRLFNEDGLNNSIKTPNHWLLDHFKVLNSIK
jgi:5'-3' exonuclease